MGGCKKYGTTEENSYNINRDIFIERFLFYIEDFFDEKLLIQAFEGEPGWKTLSPRIMKISNVFLMIVKMFNSVSRKPKTSDNSEY